jgi:hypothetical protein
MQKSFLKTQGMQSYVFGTAKIDQQSHDAAQNSNSVMKQKFWEPIAL